MTPRVLATTLSAAFSLTAGAAEFHPIADVATNMVDGNPAGNPVTNIYQGAGIGFDAAEPHAALTGTWYTDAPGGFPSDYVNFHDGPEYIWFDLGSDVILTEISFWGYSSTNSNGMREFNLNFATDAEGGDGAVLGDESYATSITASPAFEAVQDPAPRQSFSFPAVLARYVRVEATSTFYNQPGAGAGGDRVGIGEIAFELTITEDQNISVPAELALALDPDNPTDFDVPVTNSGEEDLIITATAVTGTNAAAFTVVTVISPIESLTTENIAMQFDPTGLSGPISATLQITSNDPDTPTAEVLLTGTLPEFDPDISTPAEVALTAGGAAQTLTVPVTNNGRAQLDITGTSLSGPNAAAFTVTSAPASIAALASGEIQVAFDPAGISGELSATLRIDSNDPDTPMAEVLLSGGVGASFFPISAVEVNMVSGNPGGNPLANIIQGPGVGFSATYPHDGPSDVWYTDAPGGFPSDYINFHDGPEYIWFDLGSNVVIAEISFWAYSLTNANGMREFNLSFATEAEGGDAGVLGDESYGLSIPANPAFEAIQDTTPRQSFTFPGEFARYVRVEATSTFFDQPGGGPGGDRLGIGEIAFEDTGATPGNQFAITSITLLGGEVILNFTSRPGLTYAIFRSTDLMDWEELDDSFASGGESTEFFDLAVPDAPRVFYQIRLGEG